MHCRGDFFCVFERPEVVSGNRLSVTVSTTVSNKCNIDYGELDIVKLSVCTKVTRISENCESKVEFIRIHLMLCAVTLRDLS